MAMIRFCSSATEVDEDVAAAHEVELGERRIARQVVADEDAQLAHGLADAVAAIDLGEEAPPPLVADVAQRAVGVDAGARLLDRLLADVGAEDLDRARARRSSRNSSSEMASE